MLPALNTAQETTIHVFFELLKDQSGMIFQLHPTVLQKAQMLKRDMKKLTSSIHLTLLLKKTNTFYI